MLDRIADLEIILGNNANNYTKLQKRWALEAAKREVEAYTGRTIELANYKHSPPDVLENRTSSIEYNAIGNAALMGAILDIAIIKLQRLGTEALASQSFSGVSESFLSGYPAHITATLNRYRRIKVIG